jgi:hypothetical protein
MMPLRLKIRSIGSLLPVLIQAVRLSSRLNRSECANSIRDLLGLDMDATTLLPAHDMSHGLNNMAEVPNISPSLMDSYISAASKISRLALGDAKMKPWWRRITARTPFACASCGWHSDGHQRRHRGGL